MLDILFRFFFGLGFVGLGFFYLHNWKRLRGDKMVGYIATHYLMMGLLMFGIALVMIGWSVVACVEHWG